MDECANPFETLKNVLRHVRNPEALDDHPWVHSLIVQEALMLGASGGVLALVVGVPLVWRLARVGLDFRRYLGRAYAYQGVLFDPVILGHFGLWILPYVFIVAIGATVLASLYPAWYAARTDPAVALRVAQ